MSILNVLSQVYSGVPMKRLNATFAVALLSVLAQPLSAYAAEQKYPDVVGATARQSGTDRYDFDVTVSSPYDTPQRYADAFRVMSRNGRVFGERTLWHDHASEQPFTRDLYGVAIPGEFSTVVIQARDQKYGYGGKTFELHLPGRK